MYANAEMKTMPGQYREVRPEEMLGHGYDAKQVPPIGMAIEQLEKELHGLREVIRALEQRLSPVLRPVPETMGKEQHGAPGGSPLAHQLDEYCRMVRSGSANVRALIDCLEL